MTRKDYRDQILAEVDRNGVVKLIQVQKAKDEVRKKYQGISEMTNLKDGFIPESGVHIHHIIPQSVDQDFALFRENLIALTPGQHLSFAHIKGNTQRIDPEFQKKCIKVKFDNIKESLSHGEDFYIKSNFIKIINNIFDWNLSHDSSLDTIDEKLLNI